MDGQNEKEPKSLPFRKFGRRKSNGTTRRPPRSPGVLRSSGVRAKRGELERKKIARIEISEDAKRLRRIAEFFKF